MPTNPTPKPIPILANAPRTFVNAEEALAYTKTDEFRRKFEEAQKLMREQGSEPVEYTIRLSPGDAEMVASWAESGLRSAKQANPEQDTTIGMSAVARLREQMNDAARELLGDV